MASAVSGVESRSIFRFSWWDALFVTLAALHGIVLTRWAVAPIIAVGVWWNSNTISHNFIHRPFFRERLMNAMFSAYESALLGIPQALWRDRHLAHHAGIRRRPRVTPQLVGETLVVLAVWLTAVWLDPVFFLTIYLPGYFVGLAMCAMQGHFEHARGTTSHYGVIYNCLFFNDGYHFEHHANPATHWTKLPQERASSAFASRWPALIRWLECLNLETLEKLELWCPVLQRFVLRTHRRAFSQFLPQLPDVRRRGGLFPRSALILRELMTGARVVDRCEFQETRSCATVLPSGHRVRERALCARRTEQFRPPCDSALVSSDDAMIYQQPPARGVLVHDWIWRRRGTSKVVSLLLLKRVNLVRR
jgi:hypothetical protein